MEMVNRMPKPEGPFLRINNILDKIASELDRLSVHNPNPSIPGHVDSALKGIRLHLAALQCFHAAGTIYKEEANK